MNRLGLKIGCLIVAIVIWIQVAATATVEQTVALPVAITGLDAGCTVAGSDLPQDINVRLRGSKLRLLAHRYLHRHVGEVVVDLADRTPGRSFTYLVQRADVRSDLQVTEIVGPDRLSIRIDGQLERRVPVVLSTIGHLPDGYGYVEPPMATPDSLTISGPARYFPDRPTVRTVPLDLGGLEGTGTLTLRVLPPDVHLQLSAHEVTVRYGVGPLAERTVAEVPVTAVDADGDVEVGVSPSRTDVMVRGVADSLRALDGMRLRVTVSAAGLPEGVHLVTGRIEAPAWITVIGSEPAQFQVIIGKPADAAHASGGAGG